MQNTLTAESQSITWKITTEAGNYQMTFNSGGTGNIGSKDFHYSVGPSGNPEFPLAFIAQAPHPIMQQAYQVWSGMANVKGGGGFITDGWGDNMPGSLTAFQMVPA